MSRSRMSSRNSKLLETHSNRFSLATIGFTLLSGALLVACGAGVSGSEDPKPSSAGAPTERDESPEPAAGDDSSPRALAGGTVTAAGACESEGSRAEAADGCNSCICERGAWACTEKDCSTCPQPSTGGICAQVMTYAKSPGTERCCEYPTPCSAPAGWAQFGSLPECQAGGQSSQDQ